MDMRHETQTGKSEYATGSLVSTSNKRLSRGRGLYHASVKEICGRYVRNIGNIFANVRFKNKEWYQAGGCISDMGFRRGDEDTWIHAC